MLIWRQSWRLGDKGIEGPLLSNYFYWFHELSRDYITSYAMKSLPVEKYKGKASSQEELNLVSKQA
ncbi:hypothetical protein AVEN_2348-1, partial [Araneus ventricosus]